MKCPSSNSLLAAEGRHGEELLEFSLRRVYGDLPEKQQSILKVLSLMGTQLPVEALAAGAELPVHEVADHIEELREYSLIETQYDLNYRDIVFSLLPVTNTFVYRDHYLKERRVRSLRKEKLFTTMRAQFRITK